MKSNGFDSTDNMWSDSDLQLGLSQLFLSLLQVRNSLLEPLLQQIILHLLQERESQREIMCVCGTEIIRHIT